jgi:hypothetical protein
LHNFGTNGKKSSDNCRRETFVKRKDNRKTNPFVEVPDTCTSSPRRTTFIVKQNKNNTERQTNDRKTVKQNGHQHFEKDIVTTKTLVQNEVETVSTTHNDFSGVGKVLFLVIVLESTDLAISVLVVVVCCWFIASDLSGVGITSSSITVVELCQPLKSHCVESSYFLLILDKLFIVPV